MLIFWILFEKENNYYWLLGCMRLNNKDKVQDNQYQNQGRGVESLQELRFHYSVLQNKKFNNSKNVHLLFAVLSAQLRETHHPR